MMKNGKRHITPGTAARIIGKSKRTVQRMVERGEVPAIRSNTGRIWIPADEFRRKVAELADRL